MAQREKTEGETAPRAAPLQELPATLGAALSAALVLGTLLGLVDGAIAAALTPAALGPLSLAGCLAGAAAEYAAVALGVTLALALAAHAAISRWNRSARLELFVALLITGWAFCALAWWTRPLVLYGRPWNHPGRIAWAVVCLALAILLARFTAHVLRQAIERHGSGLRVVCALVALAGGAWIFAQRGTLDGHGVPNERTRDMPNVLLVVVDAMRADTLGCYGDARVRSPHIDRLAREGVRFERAIAQTPFTWPAFGSMLTGKYPRRHGLVKMKPGVAMGHNVTLASHLETATRAGPDSSKSGLVDEDVLSVSFHTGAVSNGSGLLQGFDLYFEQMAGHGLITADSAWSVFRADLLLHVLRAKIGQKTGTDVAGAARAWFAEHGRERFFAMVHLYSTHTPYDPPQEFRELYVDPSYDGPARAFYAQHREGIERGEYKPTEADVRQIKNLYLAGVTQADAAIGGLLAELERQGVLDKTLVIVTADHGESLGEHGLWEHNHIVQTNLRVPLVLRLPGALPAGVRVTSLVEQVDLLPTVCRLLGIEPPNGTGEYERLDGHDLVPLSRGEVERVRTYAFAENARWLAVQDERWKLIVPTDAIDAAEWWIPVGPRRAALFDLVNDSDEVRSVLDEHRAEADRLFVVLREWNKSLPIPRMELSHRDLEDDERFRKLGYAGNWDEREHERTPPDR